MHCEAGNIKSLVSDWHDHMDLFWIELEQMVHIIYRPAHLCSLDFKRGGPLIIRL